MMGAPHPGSVGDNRVVVVVDGAERSVTAVRWDGNRMILETDR